MGVKWKKDGWERERSKCQQMTVADQVGCDAGQGQFFDLGRMVYHLVDTTAYSNEMIGPSFP
jgi:hypothetical protein